jgi:tRNA A-37 threonylcarbamoyl transferase component Bud32
MHFSLLREVLKSELGKDPADLFAAFDKEPFAAASIGQVHRATLKSGEDVAVKIQYPGIGRAIKADLRNLMALIFPVRLGRSAESVRGQVEAMRDMLAEEMDYVREARNTGEARALFTAEDGIVVPRVFEDYSTSRILTTEFLTGKSFGGYLADNPSQEERDAMGRKLNVAWFRMYHANASYADPHSGNYVMMSDGRLGLLDFGCVQHFTPEDMVFVQRNEAYLDGAMTFEDNLRADGYTESELTNEAFMAPLRRNQWWLTYPSLHEGPFDFSDPVFFKKGIDSLKEMVEKVPPAPPMYLYCFRSLFGMRVLCYRLGCRVDIRAIRQEEKKRIGRS